MTERFVVRPDVRVFRLFCALNAAGYDSESAQAMHPVRVAVRDALRGFDRPWLYGLQAVVAQTHQFLLVYWALNHRESDLTQLGRSLSELLADQRPGDDAAQDYARELDGRIGQLMACVLNELPWQGLWETHRAAHEADGERYREAGSLELDRLEAYLRSEPPSTQPVTFIPNLLDSHYTGYSIDTADGICIVGSPSETTNTSLVAHEYAHKLINPIVDALSDLRAETAHLMSSYADLSNPLVQPYRDWGAFLAENLVEAVSQVYDRPDAAARNRRLQRSEAGRGLTLVGRFGEALRGFEASGQTSGEYFPGMVRDVVTSLGA